MLDGAVSPGNNRVIMAARTRPKPPGCIYAKHDRLWWRGRLPNETTIRARGVKPPGARFALLDTEDNRETASQIVWRWWEDAEGTRTTAAVADIVSAYLSHAATYYRRKDGTPTGERDNIKYATRPLVSRYGQLPADRLDIEQLEQVQNDMVSTGLARTTINARMNKIRRMLKWAARKRYIPATVYHTSLVVENLKIGRSNARETKPAGIADEPSVQFTMQFMPPILRAMVELQCLCGLRSTELCIMRPRDIDRSADVWLYRPQWHKTTHLGAQRVVPLGPKAQEIVAPFLKRPKTAYCFSPAEAMKDRRETMRALRKTPIQPSQRDRRKASPQTAPGERYDRRSYYNAVRSAFDQAAKAAKAQEVHLTYWSPHRLRHLFLTRVDQLFGPDAARASGGHASLDATEIYLARDLAKAKEVARAIG